MLRLRAVFLGHLACASVLMACARDKSERTVREPLPPSDAGLRAPSWVRRAIGWAGSRDSGTELPPPANDVGHETMMMLDGGVVPVLADAGTEQMTGERDSGYQAVPHTAPVRLFLSTEPIQALPSGTIEELSVSQVRELHVYTLRPRLNGQHLELRVYTAPNGDLYYQKLLPFSSEIEAPVVFTERARIPRSSHVAALVPDENGQVLLGDALHVAGTWISDRSMTGTWTVSVYLDAASQPDAELTFEMVP